MTSQTRTYYVRDSGDTSVGIWPLHEDVTVTFKYGGQDQETLADFDKAMIDLLKEQFDAQWAGTEEPTEPDWPEPESD